MKKMHQHIRRHDGHLFFFEKIADGAIDIVCAAQLENGYLDTYYIINGMDIRHIEGNVPVRLLTQFRMHIHKPLHRIHRSFRLS